MLAVIASICFGLLSGVASCPADYALEFPKQGVTDYVHIWGMRSLTQFTVCFWLKTTQSSIGTPFSYASNSADNELLIYYETNGRVFLGIGQVVLNTGVVINDGKFHQICVTWRNSDGQWKIYKDGDLARAGAGLKRGYTIHAAGSLTLGQEQDSVGGGFDAKQSFQGMLTNVNVWSYTLPASTIKEMSHCCLTGKGDVYEWSNFIYGVRGNPRLVMPPGCPCSL
ncbi:PREDICTED: neuronal pentraxin-1-like [Acropora digitifera]|uniref:neuronal pentraxin-1-like n=1 Tax=Acropora digitifera TaxID=70779 RepID=UPI00077A6AFD|nr:PREDICTED: neuronal pentraxin-1-like [Acropora digitifera]